MTTGLEGRIVVSITCLFLIPLAYTTTCSWFYIYFILVIKVPKYKLLPRFDGKEQHGSVRFSCCLCFSSMFSVFCAKWVFLFQRRLHICVENPPFPLFFPTIFFPEACDYSVCICGLIKKCVDFELLKEGQSTRGMLGWPAFHSNVGGCAGVTEGAHGGGLFHGLRVDGKEVCRWLHVFLTGGWGARWVELKRSGCLLANEFDQVFRVTQYFVAFEASLLTNLVLFSRSWSCGFERSVEALRVSLNAWKVLAWQSGTGGLLARWSGFVDANPTWWKHTQAGGNESIVVWVYLKGTPFWGF